MADVTDYKMAISCNTRCILSALSDQEEQHDNLHASVLSLSGDTLILAQDNGLL